MDKGQATQNQLRIWEALLEVRIRFQKALLEANRLPQEMEDALSATDGWGNATANVSGMLDSLLELQDAMTTCNPEVLAAMKKKQKSTEGEKDGQEDDMDEEIPSSEDEPEPESLAEEESGPKKKKRKLNDYKKEINEKFQQFIPYRDSTIQKWNDKTQLAFGKVKKGGAPQIPTLKQISHILSDKERLIKRTQTKRTQYAVIGKGAEETGEVDEEIFDDDDFYHQMLRELIDRKTHNINDPVQLSRQWLELQKLRTKLKRVVDTDASKGRKIRYDVHPKLVNFMAPKDTSTMSDTAVKELMNSLFGVNVSIRE